MTVSMIAKGVCICGRHFMIFQPEIADMADQFSKAFPGWLDVFISDRPEAYCSQCGQAITLPIPELLDPERHELGQLLEELEQEADRRSGSDSQTSEALDDLPF